MDFTISSIGQNKGAKRVWLQGNMLGRAGFLPRTRYEVTKGDGCIILRIAQTGRRGVCLKEKGDREIPVIDLNNNEELAMFDGLEHVKVTFLEGEIRITALASEERARERVARVERKLCAGEALSFGSLAHGGGVMDDAIETGFKQAGLDCELAFANEIRQDLSDHAISLERTWKKATIALNGKMQEFAFDDAAMRCLGVVDVLTAGLPCSGASVAGRAKRGLVLPEAHPEVGHLVVAFLAIIARVNPVAIILENVLPYANSASMYIIRSQLADLQYELHETVVDGAEFGALEPRKRMVMVAITKGVAFSFDAFEKPATTSRTLAEVLEPIAHDDARWSKMEGLKAKEIRDAANNKSFAMQIFTGASEKICTLTKGMSKNRSTDAKIQHPTNPELLRVPTPLEHARCKQIPEEIIAGLSATIAHELLGQSVIYSPFVALGKLLATCLQRMTIKTIEDDFCLVGC